ncbi:MAG: cusS [Myxococcales bacterium]|nr:cusS [Myxococcales bacterium]
MSASLRVRLTLSVLVSLVVVLFAFSLVLDAVLARALVRQLDARLLDDATAVAGMAEADGAAAEFEYESLPEFERGPRPAYFEAWLADGHVLARSPTLGQGDLPRTAGSAAFDLGLPDGRRGRALTLRQPLRLENPPSGAGPRTTGLVTVVVARGTEEVDGTMTSVRRWLTLLGLLALAAGGGAGVVAVSRGLRSTRALAAQIARLDVARLDEPLSTKELPTELTPVVEKLNELLGRLRDSFAREKRFTADVSHELRTPLAALRTMLEVGGSRAREGPAYRGIIEDAGVVVRQMQALCENLLALARLDAGSIVVRRQDVLLRALVDDCWRSFAALASERGLSFSNEVDVAATLATDRDHFRLIVMNLLSNAASYTAPGGAVRVGHGGADVVLEVHDSGPQIPSDALAHVFDRFFRADATRAVGVHCGIGLALVRGVSKGLGLQVTARNTEEGGVTFELVRSA